MRDPVLRVKRSDLVEALKRTLEDLHIQGDAKKIVTRLFDNAQRYQIRDRYAIQVTTKKVGKKLERTVEAETPIIEEFNMLLMAARQQAKHKSIKLIKKDDKDYLLLKEIAKDAYDFAESFDITPRLDGYKEYIKRGLKAMGRKYALNRFKSYSKSIYESFECYVIVVQDDNREKTLEFYGYWQAAMLNYTELRDQIYLEEDDRKFCNMVYGRQQADEESADYEDWIIGQFEELSFLNAIPELSQFYGENAIKRHVRYLMKKEGKIEQQDETTVTDDPEMKGYFDKLK